MVFLAHITLAQAATVINAAITYIQYSLGLALVAILVYVTPLVNTAISWTSITSTLHSSLWPTLLRTDSTVSEGTSWRVSGFPKLSLFVGILIAVTGVITPLGLKNGPLLPLPARLVNASFVPDTSPIGLATSPRDQYSYFAIAPSTVKIFSSTPYGPFGMQFRQYYTSLGGYNYTMLYTQLTVLQSLILRDDIFAVDGLIVDLTDTPGIGFWNHTLPELSHGGEWSHDVLWLEPVTSCVNLNLTIDYTMKNVRAGRFNLTDRGGFVNLTLDYPIISLDGQRGSTYDHAFKGAALSNRLGMIFFNNMTREQSYIGKSFPLNTSSTTAGNLKPGQMGPADLVYLSGDTRTISDFDPDVSCAGYGGEDEANIKTTGIHCGIFAGTPQRSDGGDPRLSDDNSTWTQSLYACASVTRARIQTITFSFDGQPDLSQLRITRRNTGKPVLWATEKTSIGIGDVDLLWGNVDDSYEGNPSLSTIRSEVFYVPAGQSDIVDIVAAGSPNTVPAGTWSEVYQSVHSPGNSYTGEGNYALLRKFESIINNDSINGPARVRNLIWTDIIANNIVGNATSTQFNVSVFQPSVSYQLVYAIPAILLLVMWVFAFLTAVCILTFGSLKLSYMRDLINHTSVGRVVVGDSRLTVTHGPSTPENDSAQRPHSPMAADSLMSTDGAVHSPSTNLDSQSWARTAGLSLVKFLAAPPKGD